MNRLASNSRIHLPRWAVTALAEKHGRQDHHLGLPGPRQPQPAGDANVSFSCAAWRPHRIRIALVLLLAAAVTTIACDKQSTAPSPLSVAGNWQGTLHELSDIPEESPAGCALLIEQSGSTFTGDGILGMRCVHTDDGLLDGTNVSFSILAGERRIEFAGSLTDSSMQGRYLVRIQGDSLWANTWILRRVRVIKHANLPASLNEEGVIS
jgi:hypothetical protein